MFYVYVLRSCKTDRRYVGSCENVDDRLRRHNAGHSKATRMAFHGFCCTVTAFRTAPKPREKSGITNQDEAAMNSTSWILSAVAAATGPEFKSSRPDL